MSSSFENLKRQANSQETQEFIEAYENARNHAAQELKERQRRERGNRND